MVTRKAFRATLAVTAAAVAIFITAASVVNATYIGSVVSSFPANIQMGPVKYYACGLAYADGYIYTDYSFGMVAKWTTTGSMLSTYHWTDMGPWPLAWDETHKYVYGCARVASPNMVWWWNSSTGSEVGSFSFAYVLDANQLRLPDAVPPDLGFGPRRYE